MSERGSALIEMLIVTLVVGVVWAAAARVLADLPAQAAAWEDSAARRQAVRAIETRIARTAAGTAPLRFTIDGNDVAVPAVWPRRLGFWRSDEAGVVRPDALTLLTRVGVQRWVTLVDALPAAGGHVGVAPQAGCGALAACGIAEGDTLLAVDATGAVGLFRVEDAAARIQLEPLMAAGAPVFPAGSVLTLVSVDVLEFDAGERALRAYDGYRSDNIVADGVDAVSFEYGAAVPASSLSDGPFTGTGWLAYDIDQLRVRAVTLRIHIQGEHALRWRVH